MPRPHSFIFNKNCRWPLKSNLMTVSSDRLLWEQSNHYLYIIGIILVSSIQEQIFFSYQSVTFVLRCWPSWISNLHKNWNVDDSGDISDSIKLQFLRKKNFLIFSPFYYVKSMSYDGCHLWIMIDTHTHKKIFWIRPFKEHCNQICFHMVYWFWRTTKWFLICIIEVFRKHWVYQPSWIYK